LHLYISALINYSFLSLKHNTHLQLADVETSKNQVNVFAALKQGNEAQKLLQKAVALEDVEKLMEDTAEAREYQDQLQRALGESWTGQDESEIEAELAVLETEVSQEQLPSVPAAAAGIEKKEEALPSVPTHKPIAVPAAQRQENEPQPLFA
jgi:charged multivesicular body protein 6